MIRFLLTGHVDHGKSTLGGRLLYQCGAFDEREAQKVFEEANGDKMSSFRWARLLDTWNEERERGITVDCNEVEFDFKGHKFKLIDTPGHKLFVRNLIEAVYRNTNDGVIGVLVLSAIPSELDSSITQGQVKEDIILLRAIGVNSIVVAINKMDRLNWSPEAFEYAKNKILPILKSARYKEVRFCSTSGFEGQGLITESPLKDGPSLIDTLISFPSQHMSNSKSENKPVESQCLDLPKYGAFSANIFILNCLIFSSGYQGIIHTIQGEFNFNVDKIKRDDKKSIPFLKTGEKGIITFSLNEKLVFSRGDRIVFRNSDQTIGYGIIS